MSGPMKNVTRYGSVLARGICVFVALGISLAAAGCTPVSAKRSPMLSPQEQVASSQTTPAGKDLAAPLAPVEVTRATDSIVDEILRRLPQQEGKHAPVIMVDDEHFTVQGIEPAEKEQVIDRLRRELNRAANGRLTFVGRYYVDILQQERELAQQTGKETTAGGLESVDYRLTGSISMDISPSTQGGEPFVFYQVSLKMTKVAAQATDGESLWEGNYPIRRFASFPKPAQP